MKRILVIALSLVFVLSVADLALAADKEFNYQISADVGAGYLVLPGFNGYSNIYDNGSFFGDINSVKLRLNANVAISDELSAKLLSQFEMYRDDSSNDSPKISTAASPIADYGLTYNPGPVKLIFDAMGDDEMIGIKGQELLKLNVARRYVKRDNTEGVAIDPDYDPNIYRYYADERFSKAKQLTLEVPFKIGRFVSVFSLEPTPQGNAGAFVGGFGQLTIGSGTYALGYQAKMTNDNADPAYNQYANPVPADYFVFAADYSLNDNIRLQLDYSTRDDGGTFQPSFKPVQELECYDKTPFYVTGQMNSALDLYNCRLALRLLNSDKYWLDASYYFKPFTLGVNYRNWAFSQENDQAQSDGYVAELYGKRDLNKDSNNYLKVFYRTDESFGACIMFIFK
jgi:hypothetical protein